MKKYLILLFLFFICCHILESSNDCGQPLNCDPNKKYPYVFCDSKTGNWRPFCLSAYDDFNAVYSEDLGEEFRIQKLFDLPICLGTIEYECACDKEVITNCNCKLEDEYLEGHLVFSVAETIKELKEAFRVWNCVCGKQDEECNDANKINIVFSADTNFWNSVIPDGDATGILGISGHLLLTTDGGIVWSSESTLASEDKCAAKKEEKIYFNVSKTFKHKKRNPNETLDAEVQFFINEKYITNSVINNIYGQEKRVFSFLYTAVHEIGHTLGLPHYEERDCMQLPKPSGVMNATPPEARGKFAGLSHDDKCSFSRLYCPTVGIFEYQPQTQKVFPNPGKHIVTIDFELPKYTENLKMYINDVLGQTLLIPIESGTFESGEQSVLINVESLPVGIYFIIIEAGSYRTAQPLTIIR